MSGNGTALEDIPPSVKVTAKEMPNGEVRTRLAHSSSGLSCGITSTFEHHGASGWQNSHRHTSGIREIYVVQEGWIVIAELGEDEIVRYRRYGVGEVFTISTPDAHNVYVAADTVFACVKHGSKEGRKDWEPAPELDRIVEGIDEEELILLC